uniref:Uncharacterized protein n=1 Tax=Avena sativa TaxID=4498 RepID=A0ACD5VTF8_AVESA
MPPRSNQTSFTGVRFRPSGRFYAEIRAAGERIVLGTFDTAELAARAWDAAAWRLGRSRAILNFHDCETLEEAEFVVGVSTANLVSVEQRRRARQLRRHIDIAEADERAMEAWRRAFPRDVLDEEAFFTQRRADRATKKAAKMEVRWKKAFIEVQYTGPQMIDADRWLDQFLTTPSASSASEDDGDF